ncbi:Universal stress protein [Actinomadura rubteroloni]|uniref:Universal stress protein n=1 Tax=Actinomadura rubteroloni TaxID=1926885 RepID=A0A2P4UEQ8_9ACTN|nr:universal stress protein [Actinomadura rubteroloni]POM23547.1 Universal stress protein [Actinomadura rubteroloni]
MSPGTSVVVGYDGSEESERALAWAAEEAALRRLPLTVCHAWHWPYPVTYIDHEGTAIVRRMGQHVLDHGVSLARALRPGLKVHGRLLDGPAHAALVHAAADAEVIVVGGRDEPAPGSTALRLPEHADRPVVVVRPAGRRSGEIVAGADGSAAGDAALGFAFEEAALRGRCVRAVYGCWEPGAGGGRDLALFHDADAVRRERGALLERAVAPWLAKYPQVDARTSLVVEPPRKALLDAAQTAALVVVGDRGTGGFDALRLGTTSGTVLRYAPCAVAVVPSLRAGRPSGRE